MKTRLRLLGPPKLIGPAANDGAFLWCGLPDHSARVPYHGILKYNAFRIKTLKLFAGKFGRPSGGVAHLLRRVGVNPHCHRRFLCTRFSFQIAFSVAVRSSAPFQKFLAERLLIFLRQCATPWIARNLPSREIRMRPRREKSDLRERQPDLTTSLSEPLVMRILEEVIQELQAEVDREKEKKKLQPPLSSTG
jgi:hypothetical protein